jgi:hypothetical protein
MLLKMEKDVNACLRVSEVCNVRCSRGHFPFGKNLREQGKKKYNNALAHGLSCGRLASFDAPLL